MEIVAVRLLVPGLLAAEYVMIPEPVPDLPDVIASQPADVAAAQVHPLGADNETDPVPPDDGMFSLAGDSVYMQVGTTVKDQISDVDTPARLSASMRQ
jgi:hypothetical protein